MLAPVSQFQCLRAAAAGRSAAPPLQTDLYARLRGMARASATTRLAAFSANPVVPLTHRRGDKCDRTTVLVGGVLRAFLGAGGARPERDVLFGTAAGGRFPPSEPTPWEVVDDGWCSEYTRCGAVVHRW
jgi:hypothetical protein